MAFASQDPQDEGEMGHGKVLAQPVSLGLAPPQVRLLGPWARETVTITAN